jgi:hypothetical protein
VRVRYTRAAIWHHHYTFCCLNIGAASFAFSRRILLFFKLVPPPSLRFSVAMFPFRFGFILVLLQGHLIVTTTAFAQPGFSTIARLHRTKPSMCNTKCICGAEESHFSTPTGIATKMSSTSSTEPSAISMPFPPFSVDTFFANLQVTVEPLYPR